MTAQPEPLDVAQCIGATSYQVFTKYKRFVSQEDLEQEGWLWVLEHPKLVLSFQEYESPKTAWYFLNKKLWSHMEKFARGERAQGLGYDPDDEQFYGTGMLNLVLPAVLNGDTDQPVTGPSEGASSTDPAEGGNWQAIVLDVRRAWLAAGLTDDEREGMVMYHRDTMSQADIAEHFGRDQSSVSRLLNRAAGKIIDRLGGPRPKDCKGDCECHAVVE